MNKDKLSSPPGIFIIYILSTWFLIQIFRLIFPVEAAPLEYFATKWRFLRGAIEFMEIYAALALSGLVLPFAIKISESEDLRAFSPQFLQSLKGSIFMAFAAAAIYALVSLLLLPAAHDHETNLRYQGTLYNSSKESAIQNAKMGEWDDVERFLGICDQIWPQSPALDEVRIETGIRLEEARIEKIKLAEKSQDTLSWLNITDESAPTATEALDMAQKAIDEERFFDAHWLAVLAGRIAIPGSVEADSARRLESRAWNEINSMEPNAKENENYRIYRLKRDGYEALVNEDWVLAYYIFYKLRQESPSDPDIEKYFAMSERGCATIAFFIDEMEFAMGATLTDALYSLPYNAGPSGHGRMIIRFNSLSLFPDLGYGSDMEIFAFDRYSNPAWYMKAPYVKLLPKAPWNDFDTQETRVSLICKVLDRSDQNAGWQPEIQSLGETPPFMDLFTIETSWDDFCLLTEMFKGKEYFPIRELLAASKIAEKYGYLHEVFEAEILRRLANQAFFLAMAILALTAGWRYRAVKVPRYLFVPMLAVLPIVYHGLVQIGRNGVNNLAIWAIITFGFSTALVLFGIAVVIVFIGSMLLLASQRG